MNRPIHTFIVLVEQADLAASAPSLMCGENHENLLCVSINHFTFIASMEQGTCIVFSADC